MYQLVYLVIGASAMAEFFTISYKGSGYPILPGPLKFLPEMLSAVFALYIVVCGLRQNFRNVPTKYAIAFGAITLIIVCGVFANQVAPGPILNGMRYYLRGIPFFFLPAVLPMQNWRLRRYLYLILGLSFIQVPLSIYQRLHLEATHHTTGDGVMGTLQDSGGLTLFLICVVCVLAAAMLRGRLSKIIFALIFVTLMIPMSINETKVTPFLFPPALLATFWVASDPGKRVRVFFAALGIFVVGGAIFVPLYNYFNALHVAKDEQITIASVFTQKFLSSYLHTNNSVGQVGEGEVGRVDSLVVSFQAVASNPVAFVFGLGIGNVSASSLGQTFTGRYQPVYGPFALPFSSGTFLLELGVFAFALILATHFMILRDALYVARQDTELTGTIAAGWVGASVVAILGIFYTAIHVIEAINYCYWFFSGVIATRCLALARELQAVRTKSIMARKGTRALAH